MKKLATFCLILSSVWVLAQTEDELIQEIKTFQEEQNQHYLDKETSPLKKKERRKFKGHNFFEINLKYRVVAKVTIFENPDTIVMPTSAGTEKKYLKYANLHFHMEGAHCNLTAYLRAKEGYQDYLFVPFRDGTSGTDSYGGGRYMDLKMPIGDQVVLNFNLAYNPYCAYTSGWFCPLPPDENTLKVSIKAGLMAPDLH